jgi:hypothetical protein
MRPVEQTGGTVMDRLFDPRRASLIVNRVTQSVAQYNASKPAAHQLEAAE